MSDIRKNLFLFAITGLSLAAMGDVMPWMMRDRTVTGCVERGFFASTTDAAPLPPSPEESLSLNLENADPLISGILRAIAERTLYRELESFDGNDAGHGVAYATIQAYKLPDQLLWSRSASEASQTN